MPVNEPSICFLNCFPLAVAEVGRVLVEVLEHPLQCASEQLLAGDLADVVDFDLLDGIDEDAVQLHHLVLLVGAARLVAEERHRVDQNERQQFLRGIGSPPRADRTRSLVLRHAGEPGSPPRARCLTLFRSPSASKFRPSVFSQQRVGPAPPADFVPERP